ncbi:fibronectin type III domain-containing protein [Paenibacillus sp. FSL K6-1230]|uniref:fibronectin type III domain-containing protein n=1 Tax=Paenibacillus sp. FSL K6-1230 TaxID=2921603 RepID=UPI0030FC1FBF
MEYVGKKNFSMVIAIILFFGFAVTSTHAASVGEQLTAPEDGWKRFDDTDSQIAYVGKWSTYKNTNYYLRSGKLTNTKNSYAKFKFYGTKMRILGSAYYDESPSININVDGVDYSYSLYLARGATYQMIAFELLDLPLGTHTVTITNTDGKYTNIDAIDVDNTGYLVDLNTPSELNVSTNNGQVTLNWDQVENAESYTVYYGTESGKYTETVSVTKDVYRNYVVPGLTDGTTYYFVVTATVSGVESKRSNEVSATPNGGEQPNPEPEEPTEPEQPSGNRAIMVVTMTTGLQKEFDLSMKEVNAFISWYEAKQAGSGKASFAIDKHDNNKGPFSSRKDYILYDRVLTFEVSGY